MTDLVESPWVGCVEGTHPVRDSEGGIALAPAEAVREARISCDSAPCPFQGNRSFVQPSRIGTVMVLQRPWHALAFESAQCSHRFELNHLRLTREMKGVR